MKHSELLFSTGEKLVFKKNKSNWIEIKISDNNKTIIIPRSVIEKISDIHLSTVSLVWNGAYKNAFSANYFYIQFNIDKKTSFGQYPYLQLNFSGKKYLKTIIWRQISENSKQWKDF